MKVPNMENHSVMDNLLNKLGLNVHQFNLKVIKKKLFRVKEIPLSRNTEARILDMADNYIHQQSTDIN